MMVNREADWLFVSLGKNATKTMYRVLPSYGGDRLGEFHENSPELVDPRWFSFSVCRNPFTRTISQWMFSCEPWRKNASHPRVEKMRSEVPGYTSFEAFLRWLVFQPPDDWQGTQTAKHRDLRIDQYLRFENLEAEFATLPFVRDPVKLPVVNTTREYRGDLKNHLTTAVAAIIVEWAQEDFEAFGYSTDPADAE